MGKRNWRLWIQSVFAMLAAIGMVAAFHLWMAPSSPHTLPKKQPSNLDQVVIKQPVKSVTAPVPSVYGGLVLADEIAALLANNEHSKARTELLAQALLAVEENNPVQLANTLAQLGLVALDEDNTDAADVYLSEALALFEERGDELGAAAVFMQFGRLHLIARRRARQASDAYDQLLIARWKISQGQFWAAEAQLHRVVEENLQLRRYGAAASAWETLHRGYSDAFDDYSAFTAGREAVRLHASSGRLHNANKMLGKLRSQGVEVHLLAELEAEIKTLTQMFEASVQKVGAAQDYDLLYNQLRAKGDVVGAWRFRLLANASLAKTASRAMYRRQPDVLVELYKSNSSMDRASESLRQARAVFDRHGLQELVDQSKQLSAQIF